MNSPTNLFEYNDLSKVLEHRWRTMLGEIAKIPEEQLLASDTEILCDHYVDEYSIDPPVLRRDEITTSIQETTLDVRNDRRRVIFDRSKPFIVAGTQVTFHVPFDGDGEFFRYRPNRFTMTHHRGSIFGQELVMGYTRTDHDAEAVKQEFARDLNAIENSLKNAGVMIHEFNQSLRQRSRNAIEQRRQKLLADRNMVESLGFPIGPRKNPVTVPVRRKKIRLVSHPVCTTDKFEPEFRMEEAAYEDILTTLRGVSVTMERSPSAFSAMNEEHIRFNLLSALNGNLEGEATGETFNFNGKTDILVRHEGKNLFIAECKFWSGPKAFSETIDQLLGYTQWRDCKLAILVFNRNKNFTDVLEKIGTTMRKHPNFRREEPWGDETCFRCRVHHRDDPRREMTLSILAFEIPGPPEE